MKGPFVHSNNSTSKIMKNLLIALIPIIVFSFYKNGILPYQKGYATIYGMFFPLIFVIVGVITSTLTELIFLKWILKEKDWKEKLKQSYAIFPGLFLSLILPINTPIFVLIIGAFLATTIGKMLYGGFGHNIFNPALIGCLFVITIYGSAISKMGGYLNVYEIDTISSATPLTNLKTLDTIGTYDTLVKPFGTLWDFFIGMIPGAIGETSTLLCILAFFYLTFKKVIKWKIPVIYIGTVFLLTWLIGNMNGLGIWYPLFQIMSGGLFFGAVFMATDPVTSPVTSVGQILYALFLGILTVLFRYLTPLPEGVLTAILTMNIFVVILDKIGSYGNVAIKKLIIPLTIGIVLAISLGYSIGKSYKTTKTTDPNFNILSKEINDDTVTYTVTQKGNGGLITSKLVIKDKKVISFEVLSQNETPAYYQTVINASFIDTLLKNQDNLEEVDTVSGATISSKALKKTIINTLKEMEVIE
jgi:electron transport complex protein RnfD